MQFRRMRPTSWAILGVQVSTGIVERIALHTDSNPHNEKYLQTKAGKLGHMIKGER